MNDVAASWRTIEAWLKSHAPTVAASLKGPAPSASIADVESIIGLSFPDDLRSSYLLQDGGDYGERELNIFPSDSTDSGVFCLLPIQAVAEEWVVWKELIDGGDFEDLRGEPDQGIGEDWWSDGWIPVAGNGAGDFLCVDMRPAASGTKGQVICAWHDMEERKLLAPSWEAYLADLAAAMDAGKVSYSKDEGLLRQ